MKKQENEKPDLKEDEDIIALEKALKKVIKKHGWRCDVIFDLFVFDDGKYKDSECWQTIHGPKDLISENLKEIAKHVDEEKDDFLYVGY